MRALFGCACGKRRDTLIAALPAALLIRLAA
jgi:hypothetical protein